MVSYDRVLLGCGADIVDLWFPNTHGRANANGSISLRWFDISLLKDFALYEYIQHRLPHNTVLSRQAPFRPTPTPPLQVSIFVGVSCKDETQT